MTRRLEGCGVLLQGLSLEKAALNEDGMLYAVDDDELVVVDIQALLRLPAKPR